MRSASSPKDGTIAQRRHTACLGKGALPRRDHRGTMGVWASTRFAPLCNGLLIQRLFRVWGHFYSTERAWNDRSLLHAEKGMLCPVLDPHRRA